MRGKKAKAIRKTIYKDQSLRSPRRYARVGLGQRKGLTIVNDPDGLRAQYQQAKRSAQADVPNVCMASKTDNGGRT